MSVFLFGGKANIVLLILFYSTLLALTDFVWREALTDRQTDGKMNTLVLRGLEEPAHASRGLEEPFLQLCCCVSFGSGGK